MAKLCTTIIIITFFLITTLGYDTSLFSKFGNSPRRDRRSPRSAFTTLGSAPLFLKPMLAALKILSVLRDLKAWNIREEWATAGNDGKVSARPTTLHRETAVKGWTHRSAVAAACAASCSVV